MKEKTYGASQGAADPLTPEEEHLLRRLMHTRDAIAERRAVRQLIREARKFLREIDE